MFGAIIGAVSAVQTIGDSVGAFDGDAEGPLSDDERANTAIAGGNECPGEFNRQDIRQRLDKLPLSDQRNYRQQIESTTSWLEGLLTTNTRAANAGVYRGNGSINCVVNTTGERKIRDILRQIIFQSDQLGKVSPYLPPPEPIGVPVVPAVYSTEPTDPAGAYEVFTGSGGSVSQNVADTQQGDLLETLEGALANIQTTIGAVIHGAASGAAQTAEAAAGASTRQAGIVAGIDTGTIVIVAIAAGLAFFAFK